MNIADKIGVYLLLSIVFTLAGGVFGQVLPGTEATETIIFSLACIGILMFIGAISELIIRCIDSIGLIYYETCKYKFIDLLRAGQMILYSAIYVSLLPAIGTYIYDEGGSIYADTGELMFSLYGPLENVFSFAVIAYIVVVTIGGFVNYSKKYNK